MGSPASIAHGPALVGTFLNVLLYGIMVTQCLLYFSNFPNDKSWMKALVFLLFLADTLNSVFDMWWIYDVLVNNFDNLNALTTANWIFATDPAMVSIISTLVELFFAWRVKVLTGNYWVTAIIVCCAFGSACGGIGTAIAIHFVPQFADFQKFQAIVIVWSVCAMVADSTIALALTWHLKKHKTGFTDTDDILDKIIRRTVQNGGLTAMFSVVHLVTYLADSTGLHLAFNFPLAKLYTNSLMSSLNSRASWGYASSDVQKKTRDPTMGGTSKIGFVNVNPASRAEVFVHVESHEMVDTNKSDLEWSSQSSTNGPSRKHNT